MRHFAGYHNREGMGYPASSRDPLSVYTNKPVQNLMGGIVWLVEGQEGKQRKQFTLSAVFMVESIEASGVEGFTSAARGPGRVFQTPPALNELEWFPDFLKWSGHFGRGVPEIKEQRFIDGLLRLLVTSE